MCLLSHVRKTVDTAVLSAVNEQFITANAQFGFESGVAITQALLHAEDNAKRGLQHAAVLDLEKAYDKVDRHTLLKASEKWLDAGTCNMVRAMLGPLRVRTKGEPTNYEATLTRGVLQGAPSSPVIFNMYIECLAARAETSSACSEAKE